MLRFVLAASLVACHAVAVDECTQETQPYILGPGGERPLGSAGDTFSVRIKSNARGNKASCTWYRDSEDPNGITIYALQHTAQLDISKGLVLCTVPAVNKEIIGSSNGKARVTVEVYNDGAEMNSNCTSHGSEKPLNPGTGSFTFFFYDEFHSPLWCGSTPKPEIENTTTPFVAPGEWVNITGKWDVTPKFSVWCFYDFNGTRIHYFRNNYYPKQVMNYDTGEISCFVPTLPEEVVPEIYNQTVRVSILIAKQVTGNPSACLSRPSNQRSSRKGAYGHFVMLEPPALTPTMSPTVSSAGGGNPASRSHPFSSACVLALVTFVLLSVL